MEVILEGAFVERSKALPDKLQKKLGALIELLSSNPFHPLLHTKYLRGDLKKRLSFRINREYRVIFRFYDNVIYVLTVGHRKDIYQ